MEGLLVEPLSLQLRRQVPPPRRHHLEFEVEFLTRPLPELPRVSLALPGLAVLDRLPQEATPAPIVQIHRVHHLEQQAQRIDRNVPLKAIDLLPVKAAWTTTFGGLCRLTVGEGKR